MIWKALFRTVTIVFIFCGSVVFTAEELLDYNDIHRVMSEILQQHVDKHEVSSEIVRSSFKSYINQFDPEKVYLFESEVDEFLNPSPAQMDRVLRDYENNNYSKYEELNLVIQNAIRRARNYRKEVMRAGEVLFQRSDDDVSKLEFAGEQQDRGFAETVPELKQRIQNDIILFISKERGRYGDRAVIQNKAKTLQAYDNLMRHKENQYLYLDRNGNPLPPDEKQNLFVMHILKALTKSLDAHTTFLDSDEAYDMKIRLEKGFQGIGVILERTPGGIAITRMIENSPAERSGLIKAGDRIVQINGINVEGFSLEQLVKELRSAKQNRVQLVIEREGSQRIPVTLKRELIAIDEGRVDVEKLAVDNGIIGKITLHSFYQGQNGITSEKDLRKAIKGLERQGNVKGLILDLRENSGGFLNQAVKVAGLFITNGVVVVSKYSSGEERYYRDMDGKVSFDGPLVVLTSKATASAAEIVAQALQDYGVAVIVGDEQTYGKGTIQAQTVTDGQSASHFKVTVGKYYTVSGKTPQIRGVKADVVVPSHYSHEMIGEEYLQHAVTADTIPPAYKDELSDVEPGLKPWYVRYYMPTLQDREYTWREIIPILREKSESRISRNSRYQSFLEDVEGRVRLGQGLDSIDKNDADLQMQEAVNILKDMIALEKKYHHSGVADH